MRRLERTLFACGIVLLAVGIVPLARFELYQSEAASPVLPKSMLPTSPVLGRLYIPRLHVSVNILNDDDVNSLSFSVGHIPGTSPIGSLGNVVLAGHRDTCFRPLRDIHIGDLIQTQAGTLVSYRVESINIVNPDDTSLLKEGYSPLLTLVTCYPFHYIGPAPRRFVVQAQMISPLL